MDKKHFLTLVISENSIRSNVFAKFYLSMNKFRTCNITSLGCGNPTKGNEKCPIAQELRVGISQCLNEL